jgi:hypothetical protein
MKSSQNAPDKPFTVWDWIAIFVTADLGSSGLVTSFTGFAAGGIWLIVIAFGIWFLHETHVRDQVNKGIR